MNKAEREKIREHGLPTRKEWDAICDYVDRLEAAITRALPLINCDMGPGCPCKAGGCSSLEHWRDCIIHVIGDPINDALGKGKD